MAPEEVGRILERFDPDRREFLKKILIGSAYAVPIVASFSMDGLTIREAVAQGNLACANVTAGNTDADLVISKSGPTGPVAANTDISYTVLVQNCGPAAAANVSVSDPVPAGTTFVSAVQQNGPAFTLSTPPVGGTGTVTATIASFPAGGFATFQIVVHVTP